MRGRKKPASQLAIGIAAEHLFIPSPSHRVLDGSAAEAVACKSAALFAYGQLTGVWGHSLSQSLPTL